MPKKKSFEVVIVQTERALEELVKALAKHQSFAIDLETTSLDTLVAEMVGISLCYSADTGFYIPLRHQEGSNMDTAVVLNALRPLLTNAGVQKVGHNLKYDTAVLRCHDIEVVNIWDTLLAGYLLRKGVAERALDLATLAKHELKYTVQPIEDLIGPKGKGQRTFDMVSIEDAAFYSAEDSVVAWRLKEKLEKNIKKEDLTKVLETIELPLVPIIVAMEQRGVRIDSTLLKKLSKKLEKRAGGLRSDIFAMAGEEFNLNSPKQLSEILFSKLQIPTKGIKRTQTSFSTATPELEKLNLPITNAVMEFRELDKLKSTYADTLPELVHPRDGRIHTSFNQAIAATGRLSSSNPNLQNIPIRSDLGKEIRRAFIADKGNVLICADYSQIELRILAHLCEDPILIEAFRGGIDIHAQTASVIEGIALDEVTADMRRAAKVVNFGILYGLGPHRLARETGMSYDSAKQFIEKYFTAYPGIRAWIDRTKAFAYKHGYTATLFGRRRYIPELHMPDQYLRSSGERMAVNMPTQGTAADIVKMAMIAVSNKLRIQKMKSEILLQVHDELVLEGPSNESDAVAALLTETMTHVVELSIPLTVDISVGENWADTKPITKEARVATRASGKRKKR